MLKWGEKWGYVVVPEIIQRFAYESVTLVHAACAAVFGGTS